MKLNKLASVAIVAALALWSSNAKTAPVGYRFETLNFSLTAAQQGQGFEYSETSSNVFVPTIKTLRITTKDLLSLLATAFDTNWPAGAQLALDDYSREIFVVDETGTNPVFSVSTGINVGDTNVVYFGFDSDTPVFTSKAWLVEKNSKLYHLTEGTHFERIFFHLFDERNGITNIDLNFDGLDVAETTTSIYSTTNTTPVSFTISEAALVAGDGIFNTGVWTVVKGKVTGSAKWNGNLPLPIPAPIQLPTNLPPIIFPTNPLPIQLPTNLPPIIFPTNPPPIQLPTNLPPIIFPTNPPPIQLPTNLPPIIFSTNPLPPIVVITAP
jgi:hypothetical protein